VRARPTAAFWVGAVLVAAVLAMAAAGATARGALTMAIAQRLLPPSAAHPFGTDEFGRDQFQRVLVAAAAALQVAGVATAIGLGAGLPIGAAAGIGSRGRDNLLMRLVDGMYAFPALLLALLVVTALGPGLIHAALALGVVNVPVFARLTRARVLELRTREYVEAARSAGASPARVLLRHILPGSVGPLLVQASASCGSAILAEAALSYLGLGVQPPYPSWGQMLYAAQGFFLAAPWLAVFPGVALTAAVLGFNLLGDGLQAWLDPLLRR
jgi:peptide/nickel transport system permease protein